MLINSLSRRWALKLKETNPEITASVEVMSYALQGILQNTITFVTALTFGMFYGNFWDVLIAVIALMALRIVSGGYHFQSAFTCFIVSAAVFIIIPLIDIGTQWLLVLNVINLLLVFFFSPSNVAGHIRYSNKSHIVFKGISVLLVAINFFFLFPIVTIAFFTQAFSLLPFRKEVK